MKNIISELGARFLKTISFLPLGFLYGISNLFYLILYRILKYRLKVVRENLSNSFPDKTDIERLEIEKRYYRFLSDLIVESVKGFSINEKDLKKRVSYESTEYYDKLFFDGKNAIVVMGHLGNWEWICRSAPFFLQNKVLVAYKPLSNINMDALMYKSRSEFGSVPVPMSQVARVVLEEKEPFLLILVADQSPSDRNSSIWVKFLNQETAVLPGVEKLAKKFNLPVIFNNIKLTKRGHYECSYEVLIEDSKNAPDGSITLMHSKALEQAIKKQDFAWIWSHRRWKMKP
jgi:Kdo2-lipid IVA lauroyltransferase/acyltransferase